MAGNLDAFGAHLTGDELMLGVGAISIPGALALTFWALNTFVNGVKGVVKTATSN